MVPLRLASYLGFFIAIPAVLGVLTFVALAWMLRVFGVEEQARIAAMVRSKLKAGSRA